MKDEINITKFPKIINSVITNYTKTLLSKQQQLRFNRLTRLVLRQESHSSDKYKPYILNTPSEEICNPIVIKRINHIPEKFSNLHKALCLQDTSRRQAKAKFRKSVIEELNRRNNSYRIYK